MRREYVGHVFVDHGGVAIVDPQFVDISEADQDRIISASTGAPLDCGEERLPVGVDHVGTYVTTGLGDGHYPVYADTIDLPGGGTRVARIVIDCLGTEPESQSDELREAMVGATDLLREVTEGGIDVRLPYDERLTVDDDLRRRALGEDQEDA